MIHIKLKFDKNDLNEFSIITDTYIDTDRSHCLYLKFNNNLKSSLDGFVYYLIKLLIYFSLFSAA